MLPAENLLKCFIMVTFVVLLKLMYIMNIFYFFGFYIFKLNFVYFLINILKTFINICFYMILLRNNMEWVQF